MRKKQIVDYWTFEADEALSVAHHLFEKKDFSYALFFGHLAVEKQLKALFVLNKDQQVPRSHNLLRLAKSTGIHLSQKQEDRLIRITAFNLEARYPDYKREFRKKCTKEFTFNELHIIEEVFLWLRSMLPS